MKTSNIITGIALLTASAALAAPIEYQGHSAVATDSEVERVLKFLAQHDAEHHAEPIPDDGPVPEWDWVYDEKDGHIVAWTALVNGQYVRFDP